MTLFEVSKESYFIYVFLVPSLGEGAGDGGKRVSEPNSCRREN